AGEVRILMHALLLLLAGIVTFDYPQPVRYHPGESIRDSHRNAEFVVRVRDPEGAWQDLYEHAVDVDWNDPHRSTLLRFDFEGRVEVAIQRTYQSFSKVVVRPTSAGVRPRVVGDTVYLVLQHPANLSVEFDGDKHHNVHIFAGAIAQAPPAGTDVVIF